MKTILATAALAATLVGASVAGASATVVIHDGSLLDVQADTFGIHHNRNLDGTSVRNLPNGTGYSGRGTATGGPVGGLPNGN